MNRHSSDFTPDGRQGDVSFADYSGVPTMQVEEARDHGLLSDIFDSVREDLSKSAVFALPDQSFFAKMDRFLNKKATPHAVPKSPDDIVSIIQSVRPDFEGVVTPHRLRQACVVQSAVASRLKERTGRSFNMV